MSESNKVKETVEAVQGIVEAIPIYQDLAQPAVQEIGKGLHTISKLIHVALAPVSATVWGYEQISKYVQSSLEEKLKDVPPEKIISPDISIAGPALEALRFVGDKKELREMFTTLLSTSMNSETEKLAPPSFVEVIKQLNTDEALLLTEIYKENSIPIIKIKVYSTEGSGFDEPLINFSILPYQIKCISPELGPSYLENLKRLNLINISYSTFCTAENSYEPFENYSEVQKWRNFVKSTGKHSIELVKGSITKNNYGEKFINSCT